MIRTRARAWSVLPTPLLTCSRMWVWLLPNSPVSDLLQHNLRDSKGQLFHQAKVSWLFGRGGGWAQPHGWVMSCSLISRPKNHPWLYVFCCRHNPDSLSGEENCLLDYLSIKPSGLLQNMLVGFLGWSGRSQFKEHWKQPIFQWITKSFSVNLIQAVRERGYFHNFDLQFWMQKRYIVFPITKTPKDL